MRYPPYSNNARQYERDKPMFRNLLKKEAGQGITEMVLLSAAVVSFAMGIVHYIGAFFEM